MARTRTLLRRLPVHFICFPTSWWGLLLFHQQDSKSRSCSTYFALL